MKNHFRKGAFRWASLILTVVMAVNLLPLTAMAEGTDPWDWSSGSGSSDDPFVGLISSQEDLDAAEAKINDNDVNNSGKYYTVSLLADIACTNSFNVSRNNITLLGNGHTLDFSNINNAMNITGQDTVLSLGNSNSSGTPSRLTIIGNPKRNGDPFICVSSYASGKDYGTLKMYDGVTITGAVGDNTFGGAVTVGSAGYFEMNGGTIQNCGIRGGSVCYGGGVAVINGGSFVMNGGTIQNCFLKQGYSHQTEDYNVFFNYCAGAGVFVNNRSYFKMTGGEIKNNEISTNAGVGAYGVGGGIAIIGDRSSYAVGSRVDITSGRITGNKATLGGAGIAICGLRPMASALANPDDRYADELANPGLYISGGTINDNHADGNSNYGFGGGGILIYHLNYGDTYSNNVNIKNARITGNTVDNGPGGGIASLHLSSGFQNDITIENCDITNNHALWGGGICMRNDSNTSKMNTAVNGSILTGNAASGDLGGGISVEGTGVDKTTLQFDSDCAIYDNTAAIGAADLFMKDSTVKNLTQAMTAENGKTYAWYWDYETIADTTYEYPAGIQNPCDRYSDDNRVAYTAIPSETEMRYLKAAESGYTVTFDLNYAGADASTAPSAQTVYSGQTADEPTDPPTRDGYVFDGWYKDALCTQRYDFSSPVTANITLYAKWVQGLPHYILQYGDGRPGDGGDQYTFPYDPASPEKLPTEVKYFSQEEIEQLPEQSIYEGVTMEGTYFLAWYGYMPAPGSAINTNYPVYEKTGENTYTEFSGTPDAGTTYYQFIPCETTPDKNLGDITYYAQWVKVKIDITVDIQVDVDVSFDENLGGNVVMIDDSQKLVLAKNFRPSDIVSNNCEITLTATVANPKIPAEEAKTAEYMAQNYPNCRSISYDVEITKDIVSGGSPYSSETLKKLAAPIEIRFAVPNEWQNGTVKMLRAHTDPGTGTVTVSECQNLSSDKSWFILSSDEFSTYTLLYIPSGGGTGDSGGETSAYTLRYQSNGGTPCPDETKTSAWTKDYDSLPVPVREGYLFTGWFADSGLQTPISEDVQVNRSLVTIYAGWEKSMVPAMLNGDDHYAYIVGYPDGTVQPNGNITRAEVATIFFRLLDEDTRSANLSTTNSFSDVSEGMWFNTAISTLEKMEILNGYQDGTFRPNEKITRAELVKIVASFEDVEATSENPFTDTNNHWAKAYIDLATENGWINGYEDNTFKPDQPITRAETMAVVNRVLQRLPRSVDDLLLDMITWPDNMDETAWYYLYVQEATNSHDYNRVNGLEKWTQLKETPDWTMYEK